MRKTSLLLVVLLCGFAAGSAAAQTVTPVELFINDAFAGTSLRSDGKGSPAGTYIDFSLPGGDFCVGGRQQAAG